MSEIKIMEKPEEISWETIRDVIRQAHQVHYDAGIVMKVSTLSAEELEQRIRNNDGKCYVALYGGEVVGTTSFIRKTIKAWYHEGEIAEQTMVAVLPDFQGRHIASELAKSVEEEVQRRGFRAICLDTAEKNTKKIAISLKEHYRLVDYRYNTGHYSVELVKWFEGCPFSKLRCRLRYEAKKMKVHAIHTLRPNRKKIR